MVTSRSYKSGCQVMCSRSTSIGKPLPCLSHNKVHLSSPVSNIVVLSHRQSSDISSPSSNMFILSHSQLSKSIMRALLTTSCKIVHGRVQWKTCWSGPYPLQWSTTMRVKLARGVMKDSRLQQDNRTSAQQSRVPGDPPEREGERQPSSMIL